LVGKGYSSTLKRVLKDCVVFRDRELYVKHCTGRHKDSAARREGDQITKWEGVDAGRRQPAQGSRNWIHNSAP